MANKFHRLWKLYDYQNSKKVNEIKLWTKNLEKIQKIKLNQKLDMLEQNGPNLPPQLLAGPIFDHVYKLKVKGKVQLRPILCKGPIYNDKEFTMLLGVKEIGNKLDPENADKIAAYNRTEIINNPKKRCSHERVT